MACPALNVNILSSPSTAAATCCLYGSCVAWTTLYDTIYGAQDIGDDKKAGIKSTALRYEENTKDFLVGCGALQVTLLALVGYFVEAGPIYYTGTCGGAAIILGIMVNRVNLKDPSDCLWWFKHWGI